VTRWWVIVNPAAGREQDLERRVERALDVRGIEHVTRTSFSADMIGGVVAEGRERGYDAFVSVGGDGTASLVVNGIQALAWPSPPTLAILPAGTGSDYIRTFAIPDDLESAADHLTDESRYAVDVGLIEGTFGRRYFLNAANAGIAARTVIEAQKLPARLGSRRYIIGFWAALVRMKAAEVRIDCDGRIITGTSMNIVVANGQYFGGGMNIAPRAAAGDGLFDVQSISGPRMNAPVVIRRIVHGTHLNHRSVRRTVGRRVSVDVPDTWMVEADGEIIGSGSFTAEALQGRLLFKI